MLSLTILAAFAAAQGSPQSIRTPPEYVNCLEKAAKEAALDYEDLDDAVPRVMSACESIWDAFEQRTLRRHPNEVETLADLKSSMREQVRENYAHNSAIHQKRAFRRDMVEAAREGNRQRALENLMKMFFDCQVKAAGKAVEQGMASDRIPAHVEAECGEINAEIAKLLPRVLREGLSVPESATPDQVAAHIEKTSGRMLAGMRKNARAAYMPFVEQAKRREICMVETNDEKLCAQQLIVERAIMTYAQCARQVAQQAASMGRKTEAAFDAINSACAEQWHRLEKMADSEANLEIVAGIRDDLHAKWRREYPEMLRQAGNARALTQ